jgi:hypothetical protein
MLLLWMLQYVHQEGWNIVLVLACLNAVLIK